MLNLSLEKVIHKNSFNDENFAIYASKYRSSSYVHVYIMSASYSELDIAHFAILGFITLSYNLTVRKGLFPGMCDTHNVFIIR